MRLWHRELIPYISNQRLQGQHKECCALRGNGWGKKHSFVDYVFTYDYALLFNYHLDVLYEMQLRGKYPQANWFMIGYHGKHRGYEHGLVPVNKSYNEQDELQLLVDINDLLDRDDHMLAHSLLSSERREEYFNERLS